MYFTKLGLGILIITICYLIISYHIVSTPKQGDPSKGRFFCMIRNVLNIWHRHRCNDNIFLTAAAMTVELFIMNDSVEDDTKLILDSGLRKPYTVRRVTIFFRKGM